jgi:TetR/AcrR family transcriptional regulator
MRVTQTARRRRSRSRGRPPVEAEDDVRAALLDAAHKLFLKHGFDRVTARQIAAAAGTTPAMIHYYFGNKLGLFRAMLDRAIRPLREMLAGSLAQESAAPIEVPTLIRAQMQTAADNAWIPPFVLNEVFAERGRFRATFIRDIAARHLPLVIELIERGKSSGRFRPDLESRYAALSLLSLCLFPFVSRLVTEPLLGLKYEGDELDRFIAHTARLFLTGIEYRP